MMMINNDTYGELTKIYLAKVQFVASIVTPAIFTAHTIQLREPLFDYTLLIFFIFTHTLIV